MTTFRAALVAALAALTLVLAGCAVVPANAAPAPAAALSYTQAPTVRHIPQTRPGTITVDAHDGMIMDRPGGGYVLYGTSYGCGFALFNKTTAWCGVKAYTSPDLITWTDAGVQFDPAPWQTECAPATSFGCFRPHVVKRGDGTYVMWLNIADGANAGYATLTAPTPLGPWTRTPQRAHLAVNYGGSLPYGDQDVKVGPDGTGYVAYTAIDYEHGNRHNLIVEQLDPTMTTGTGLAVSLELNPVEAPSLARWQDVWYLTYGTVCGYCGGTDTSYATAPTPLGPWTPRGRISATSCNGQPAALNGIMLTGRWQLIYQSDTWQQLPGGGYNPNQAAAPTHLEAITPTNRTLPQLQCGATYWT